MPQPQALVRVTGAVLTPEQQHEAMHAALEAGDRDAHARLLVIEDDLAKQMPWMTSVSERLAALEKYPPSSDSLKLRLTSRKFLLSVATALGAILAAVGGALDPKWAAIIAAASTGIFTLIEGFADSQARGAPNVNAVSVKQE